MAFPSKAPTDEELFRLMMAGDEDAFIALYGRRQGGIYRFALQMSGSSTIAEDVTQEVFMALINDAHHYDPTRGPFLAYLYGIARNHVLRRLQRERPYVQIVAEHGDENHSSPERFVVNADPAGDLAREEMLELLRKAILALPAHYREVVVLCELHELSYAEAAEILGCAIGTIRSRLHRARSLLADKLRSANEMESARSVVKPKRCFA